jgi:CSLREA domain-containing protein
MRLVRSAPPTGPWLQDSAECQLLEARAALKVRTLPSVGSSIAAFMISAVACVAALAQTPPPADHGPPSQVAAAAAPQCRHEFVVTTTQDRASVCAVGSCSLREAVMAANACPGRNLIDVPAGRYPLTLGDLKITEEVTIIGAGRDDTVVEDLRGWGVFKVQHGGGIDHLSVIRQMTIENSSPSPCVEVGQFASSGAQPLDAVLLLTESRLQRCRSRSWQGGGMRINKGAYAWLIDVDVSGNQALLGGGIANMEGKLEVWKSRFSDNSGTQGGAVYSQGQYSPRQPVATGDMVTIRDSTFSNNSAVDAPGWGAQGGALHVQWHGVRVTDTRFDQNVADRYGGAVSLWGGGQATLENVEMWRNRARLGGGGMFADMDLKATRLVVAGNEVREGDGGGLYLSKTFEVSDALIRENVAVAQQAANGYWYGGRGGGVVVLFGQGEMRNSTITGNRAREGGGIYNYGFSALFNVTVSANGASLSGGGARNYAGQMWIKNGTIVNNDAPEASALSSFSSYPLQVGPDFPRTYINHTILVAGTAGQNACRDDHFVHTNGADRGLISKGFNLPGDFSCGTIATGDRSPTNPQLGPLTDNGGFAPTHRPAPFSAPLDNGATISEPFYNQAGCALEDARGVARPQASSAGRPVRCDIGALELTP